MEQNQQKLQGELVSRGFSTDLAAEFILPDYQPEIKRLLRVRALPLPVEQYLGGSAAELSGAVEFQALYAAENGALWCVTRREDYRLSCPFDAAEGFDLSEGLVCDVKTDVEGVSGRVLAPRKLTARCRVRTTVRMLADRSGTDLSPAEAGEDVERLTDRMETSRVRLGRSAPVTLTEEIPLAPDQPPMRVISASGEVFPTEAQAENDLVACRGEVLLTLLCAPEPTPSLEEAADCLPAAALPVELSRRIPFAVEIPVDGATPACAAAVWGTCAEITVSVEENRILCDVNVVLTARAVCREEVPFTRAAYSTANLTEPVFCTLTGAKTLACRNGNCSLSTSKELAELGLRPDSRVIEAVADVALQPPEAARGCYILPGNLHFRLLAQQPDGDFAAAEFDLPFRFESPADDPLPPTESASVVTPVLVKASVDGSRLLAETELSVALSLAAAETVTALASLRSGGPVPEKTADVTLCFPAPDDTLWSVAARYHTPLATLLQNNSIPASTPPSSPSPTRYLVV